MTIHLFSPINSSFSNDFITIKKSPRITTNKDGTKKPAAYVAFALGIPTAFIDTYSMPSWDTSGYFRAAIIDAIGKEAIAARTAKKNGLELPERLPDFLASLSTGGRITKVDLVSWLASIKPFIEGYVADKYPADTPERVSMKASTLSDWLSKAAAPSPFWTANQWQSLDALVSALVGMRDAEPDAFPDVDMLDKVAAKVDSNKPITDDEAI